VGKDKIVRPVFGRKKSGPDVTTTAPSKGQESLRNFVGAAAGDARAGKFRTEMPDGKKEGEKDFDVSGFATVIATFGLQDTLNKLVQRHEGKIREYKNQVEGYSDEDLQAWLANPKDSDLQRKPYFYHALIDEAKRRFLNPARRTQKEEPAQTPKREKPTGEVPDDYKHIGPLKGETLKRAQNDLIYMLANQDFVTRMRDKLEQAGDTIFSLANFTPDQESIRLRREGLKFYSLEQICNETEKTNELQWRRQPSYLGALALEHHTRVQVALSLMNTEDPSSD
jgi:hypothetical protein